MTGDGHHGEVSAITAAHDDELGGIDKSGALDEFGSPEDIVQLLATGVVAIAFLKLTSVSCSAPIVRRYNEIALIIHVLHEAVEAVHRLRGRASVNVNDGGIFLIADDVVRDVNPGRDGELAIAAWVVNQGGRDHAGRAESCDERVGELGRLLGLYVEDMEVIRSLGAAVVIEQALAITRERRNITGKGVDALGEFEAMDFAARNRSRIECLAAIDIGGPDELEAIGEKPCACISHLSEVIQVSFFEATSSRATLS